MAEKKASAGKALSKSAINAELADKTGLSKKQVAQFFEELTSLMQRELGKKGPGVFNVVPGLLQLKVKKKPATKARKGVINRFTGQPMDVPAKPATNVVRPRALKALKEMVK